MAPVAYGFLILIAGAAVAGVAVGALGGAIGWWLKIHILLGALGTVCLFFVVLALDQGSLQWLNAKVTWGTPPMALTFLISTAVARWLEMGIRLRPVWAALVAFITALIAGALCLKLFPLSIWAPVVAALGASVCLILVLMRKPKPISR